MSGSVQMIRWKAVVEIASAWEERRLSGALPNVDTATAKMEFLDALSAAEEIRERAGELADFLIGQADGAGASVRELARALRVSSPTTASRHLQRVRAGQPRRSGELEESTNGVESSK